MVIGAATIEHALLDCGASVNLLMYSFYEQLGLGELKKASVILQLADRNVRVPRGIVEDVLVQVDHFPCDDHLPIWDKEELSTEDELEFCESHLALQTDEIVQHDDDKTEKCRHYVLILDKDLIVFDEIKD
ncbi:hypothetical protein Acr_11g0010030 [Actinidia rufa]|uniref:Uncharacterized protein n=1 Tax=Actinidia rufa TaxID=165716 RepID=A0A7J0FFL6_9ERIC|nr:hypothetical protein Acr_11g0010030 [Actinidia rufa]